MFCTLNSGQPKITAAIFMSAVIENLPCIDTEIEKNSLNKGICYLKESVT